MNTPEWEPTPQRPIQDELRIEIYPEEPLPMPDKEKPQHEMGEDLDITPKDDSSEDLNEDE